MTEHTYIDCHHCAKWTIEERREKLCDHCNNSGKQINPKEIFCNMCGDCLALKDNGYYPHGLYNAKVYGGYFSDHLIDLHEYTFSLCEKCLREMFNKCKIKPDVRDITANENISYQKDLETYEYQVWLDTGGFDQAYINGKCNAIKECPNDAVYTQLYHGEFTNNCYCENHKPNSNFLNGSSLVLFIPNHLKAFCSI
jgi:hypothetical protein